MIDRRRFDEPCRSYREVSVVGPHDEGMCLCGWSAMNHAADALAGTKYVHDDGADLAKVCYWNNSSHDAFVAFEKAMDGRGGR